MRVRKKSHVEHQIGVQRYAVLESETDEVHRQLRFLRAGHARKGGKLLPQLVNGELGGVDDLIRHGADHAHFLALRPNPLRG